MHAPAGNDGNIHVARLWVRASRVMSQGLGAIIRVEEAMGLLEKALPRHAGRVRFIIRVPLHAVGVGTAETARDLNQLLGCVATFPAVVFEFDESLHDGSVHVIRPLVIEHYIVPIHVAAESVPNQVHRLVVIVLHRLFGIEAKYCPLGGGRLGLIKALA